MPTFVGKHWGKTPDGAENVLKQLHELYGKYKFMENKLVQQKRSILAKIPEIKSALEVLTHIKAKGDTVTTNFELSDAVYVRAAITKTDNVMLWLGANVMVEYTYDEAFQLLTDNLKNAQTTLETLNTHLSFLKDQITISEVNIARVHNFKVGLTQANKEAATA